MKYRSLSRAVLHFVLLIFSTPSASRVIDSLERRSGCDVEGLDMVDTVRMMRISVVQPNSLPYSLTATSVVVVQLASAME